MVNFWVVHGTEEPAGSGLRYPHAASRRRKVLVLHRFSASEEFQFTAAGEVLAVDQFVISPALPVFAMLFLPRFPSRGTDADGL
jgi:hypothetical protein